MELRTGPFLGFCVAFYSGKYCVICKLVYIVYANWHFHIHLKKSKNTQVFWGILKCTCLFIADEE